MQGEFGAKEETYSVASPAEYLGLWVSMPEVSIRKQRSSQMFSYSCLLLHSLGPAQYLKLVLSFRDLPELVCWASTLQVGL